MIDRDRNRAFVDLCSKVRQVVQGPGGLLIEASKTRGFPLSPSATIGFNMELAECIRGIVGPFDMVFYPGMGSNLLAPLSFGAPKIVNVDSTNPLLKTVYDRDNPRQRQHLEDALPLKLLDHGEELVANEPALSWAAELSWLNVDSRTLKFGKTEQLDPDKGAVRSELFLNSPLPGGGRVAFVNFFGVEIPRKKDGQEQRMVNSWNADIESRIKEELQLAQRCLVLIKGFPDFEQIWYKVRNLIPDNSILVAAQNQTDWANGDQNLEQITIEDGILQRLAKLKANQEDQGEQTIYDYLRDLTKLKIFNFHKQA